MTTTNISLNVTQTQTPTVTLVKSFLRALNVTQTQTPTIVKSGKTVHITVAVTQTQL